MLSIHYGMVTVQVTAVAILSTFSSIVQLPAFFPFPKCCW